MTPQEIFTTAYLALLDQGEKSVDEFGACVYRSEVGACAIGHLIPDDVAEHWDSLRDSYFDSSIYSIVKARKGFGVKKWMEDNIELLSEIQSAHDKADATDFVKSFREEMKQIADEFGLEIPDGN
jgi:hypothetical protein